ncbi:DUF2927 domain-containing protein [Denitrobaculum tricleocarpae]|uniref:DUF2927 domain-containing protein n=1 Tax=Denitrobaculum tricleocarpae TaxID=2591009 RepID=A0A545TGC7_9PROT|nr:DUF2927 domain-containing protein [Denitrobaculum tricleocarpae]TQV76294.1 DUF2927 domain-containing protein [Denitrobaculum tricleocarpae]
MSGVLRIGVWFPLLCLLLASCAGGNRYVALPPTLVPDPIHHSDPRLIQDPPADILAQFTLDGEGYIVDGPRSRPTEPVDHTILITNTAIAESFAKLALGSSEGVEVEFAHPDLKERAEFWEGKISKYEQDLGQAILYRGGVISARTYEALDRSVKTIARNTGLNIPLRGGREFQSVLGYFFVEDQSDMREVVGFFRALASNEPPETERRYTLLTLANSLDIIVKEDLESCLFLSTVNDDGSLGTTFIVFFLSIPIEQLESCAYEETIQAMGLFNDDNSLFNTMFTDAFKEYLFPTELDWMMLRILYDERIKSGMTRNEAMPIVREILTETRPYGD